MASQAALLYFVTTWQNLWQNTAKHSGKGQTVLVAGGVFTGVWELVTQLPSNVLLAVVFLVAVVVLVVLFHEPACERLIRIIKAFTEVRHPKER